MPAKKRTTTKKRSNLPAKLPAPPKVAQPHGGALYRGGVPGHVGGGGRPPNWLRDFCDEILADETCQDQVRAILKDKDHPAFATMWGRVSDRAAGKPSQAVELTGKDGGPVEVRQQIIIGGVAVVF